MIYNGGIYNSEWDTKKLNELGTFNRGVSKHRPRNDVRLFENAKYPFVQTGDIKAAYLYITNHSQEYGDFGLRQSKLWGEGTLCITIAANIAETAILSYPMCFPDSVVGFNAFPGESSEIFMHYVFEYIRNSIQNSASGSIQDNINIEYLESLDFKIPKKEYQDKIVNILSVIDKKILLNNKLNDNLQQQAALFYDYWFTQFDFPDANGNPYKTYGGQMDWDENLKREVPSSWTVKPVKELLNVITGKEDANFSSLNGKYKFFTCSKDALLCDEYAFEGKAILIAGNGDFNVKHYSGKFNAYQRTYVLIPEDEKYYGAIYLAATRLISRFKSGSNGSIVKFITKDDVENIMIAIPDDDVYFETINCIISTIEFYQNENDELLKIRNWLLPMLMNGQVTVSD